MSATSSSLNRRGFLASSATVGAASLLPAAARAATQDGAIRPFHIDVPEEVFIDLRHRVLATHWPDRETVTDQSQGVQLAKIQELVRLSRVQIAAQIDVRRRAARMRRAPPPLGFNPTSRSAAEGIRR